MGYYWYCVEYYTGDFKEELKEGIVAAPSMSEATAKIVKDYADIYKLSLEIIDKGFETLSKPDLMLFLENKNEGFYE